MCVRGRVYMCEQCEYRGSNVFNKYSYQMITQFSLDLHAMMGRPVVAVTVTA